MGKSGRKKVSFQDMEHEVSKATSISFKTIDQSDTEQVSFKTIEENKQQIAIPFKTFDDWIKARTANCDMALKDAISFVSEKKSAIDGEKDSPQARPIQPKRSNPSNTEASSQWTDNLSDPQQPRETPHGHRRDPHGVQRLRVHHENPAAQGDPHGQRRDHHGAQKGEFTLEPRRTFPVQPRQRQKAASTAVLHHHTTQIGQPKSRQQAV